MRNLFSRYKILVYPIAVTVASVFIIIFLIVPQLQGFLEGQEKLGEAQNRLANLEVKAKDLSSLNQEELIEELTLTLSSLPIDKDYNAIIGIFKSLASNAGVNLTSLHIGGSTESKDSFIVKADIAGPRSSLGQFLDIIEKAPRVMRIKSVETNSSLGGSVTNSTVTIVVYYSPAPTSLGSIDTPLPKLTDKDRVTLSSLQQPGLTIVNQPVTLPTGRTNPFE